MEVTLSIFELLGIVFGGGFVLTSFTLAGLVLLLRQVRHDQGFLDKLATFAGENVPADKAILLVNAGRAAQKVGTAVTLAGEITEDIFDGVNTAVAG